MSTITSEDTKTHYGNEIDLTVTYTVSVYATAKGYKDSDIATATLCWLDAEPKTEGMTNDIATARGSAILIQCNNGKLNIVGAKEGTGIAVYSLQGVMIGAAKAAGASTSIATCFSIGEIAIVKIGDKSVKVLIK